MKFVFFKIIFLVCMEVVFVKSDCDTYSGCLHQIYDGFLGFINFNATGTQVKDIEVPGYENVKLESDNVDSIYKNVASFLEELVGDYDLNSQFNVFHNINNKTSIIVKTVDIIDNFDDFDDVDITLENKTDINKLYEIKELKISEPNTDLSLKEQINSITPVSIIKTNSKPSKTRNPTLNIDELSKRLKENEIIDSYDDINDNSTDYPIIDYIDLYKDTTNEYVEMSTTVSTHDISENEKITPTYNNTINVTTNNRVYTEDCTNATDADTVFPWIAAIFIKNETSSQYIYYCDGALLSDTVIITAASCIQTPNVTSEDLLVILGKRSLKVMADNEVIAKIKEVHIHDNFTGTEQDLALLVMNVPVTLSDRVQTARLGDDGGESATTGWAISGELTFIPFKEEENGCNNDLPMNTFCAVYGNDISVCPSYGGVYVTRQSNGWFLRGIRTEAQMNNGFCVNRSVVYTDLIYYTDWIDLYVK